MVKKYQKPTLNTLMKYMLVNANFPTVLEPRERKIWKKGIKNILPHLVKLSIISSLLFFAPSIYAAQIQPQDIIEKVNELRAKYALESLSENHTLTLAAYKKAKDMLDNKYFAHRSPNGTEFYEWISREGYDFTYAGENLAKDFHDTEGVMAAWMNSPTHRANILDNDFCEIGVASLSAPDDSTLIVQTFGCREKSVNGTYAAKQDTNTEKYTISTPEPKELIIAQSENSVQSLTNTKTNPIKKDEPRTAAIGIATLFAVTVLAIEQRRHYHHVYHIPISVVSDTPTQNKTKLKI